MSSRDRLINQMFGPHTPPKEEPQPVEKLQSGEQFHTSKEHDKPRELRSRYMKLNGEYKGQSGSGNAAVIGGPAGAGKIVRIPTDTSVYKESAS